MTINNVVQGYPSQSGRPIKRQAIDLNRGQAVQRILPHVVSFGTYNDIKNLEKVSKSFCYIIPDNFKSIFRLEEQMRGLSGRLKLNNLSVVFKNFWNNYSNNIFNYYEVIEKDPIRYNSLNPHLTNSYLESISDESLSLAVSSECDHFITALSEEKNVTQNLKETIIISLEMSRQISERFIAIGPQGNNIESLRALFTEENSPQFILDVLKLVFNDSLLEDEAETIISGKINDLLRGNEYHFGALLMSAYYTSGRQQDDPKWLYRVLLPLLNFEDLDTTHTLNTIRRICTCFTEQWYPINACLEFAQKYLNHKNVQGFADVLEIAENLISITVDDAVDEWMETIEDLKEQASKIF